MIAAGETKSAWSRARHARRLGLLGAYLLGLLLLLMEGGPRALETPPATSPFYIQTNGPNSAIGNGDWYTASAAQGGGAGHHYLAITIPCGWPSGTPVHLDLFSPEMNSTAPASDEPSGPLDTTQFELYAAGTPIGPGFGTPAPGGAGSIVQTSFAPSGSPQAWVRFHTLAAPVACGTYVLRSSVNGAGNDQNAWWLRVGLDDDGNPTTGPPANTDNPDGIAGTNDEIVVGIVQVSFQHSAAGTICMTLFEYVPPGQASTTFHNFDFDGGGGEVRYYAPSQVIDTTPPLTGGTAGTISGSTVWNGGTTTTRGGDIVATAESGWWRIVSCISTGNQFIQEAQLGVPAYFAQPPTPSLTVAKSNGLTQVSPGQTFGYTITATNSNTGPSPGAANNVVFTDTLPANVTFLSCGFVAPAVGTCSNGAGVVTGNLTGAINAGSSVQMTINVRVNNSATSMVNNSVSVAYKDALGNSFPAVNASDSDAIVNSPPVANDDSATTPQGTPVTITVLANDSDPDGNIDSGSVTVTVPPPVAEGTATVNPGGTITFTPTPAFLGSSTFTYQVCDFGGLCDTAIVTVVVVPEADLSITKTDSPDPVLAGNNLTYTVTVTNLGPSDAVAANITDPLPSGTSFVSASLGCTESAGTVTCTLGTMIPGQVEVRTITVLVDASRTADLSNTVTVSSATSDPVSSNNSDTEPTVVNESADLSITKTDSPDPVLAGNNLTYTVTVTNIGPSDAVTASVSDPLPAGTSFVSASAGCTEAAGTVTCALGTMIPGQVEVRTITVLVSPSQTADLSNTATVTSSTPDPVPANNSDTEPTVVNESADLSITKTDSPDPVLAGNNLTYTITVDNAGPSDATVVAVSDTLPVGTTFVSATGGGTYDALTNTVTWTLGTFTESQAPVSFDLVVKVDSDRTADLSNTATVTSSTPDPVPANNSDTEPTVVNESADLSITKTDSPDPVLAGNNLTYTVTVTNLGPSDALEIEMTDTLAPETTLDTMSAGCIQSGSDITCTTALLPAGESVAWTITVIVDKVGTSVQDGTVIDNHVEVTSTTADPDSANNRVTEPTTVSAPDLDLTKSASPPSGSDVSPGEDIAFTITYSNLGSAPATNFVVTDTVASLLGDVSPDSSGVFDPDTRVITWNVGTVAAGVSDSVGFTVRVGASASLQTINNRAFAIAGELIDRISSNQTSHQLQPPDLLVTKSSNLPDNSEIRALEVITYRIEVRNQGTGNALGVVVTDDPPPHMNYVAGSTTVEGSGVSDSGGTSPLFGPGVNLGTLTPGEINVITLRMAVDVAAPAGALIENWAYAEWNLGTLSSGDFVDLRILRPRSGPTLRQSILVQAPSGRTIFITVINEMLELIPVTGFQSSLLGLLGLAALGFGGAVSMRIPPDLFRRRR